MTSNKVAVLYSVMRLAAQVLTLPYVTVTTLEMIMEMGMGFPMGSHSHWESHRNPMGMGIDDTIGNGNGKEWESPCMGVGMALMPMGINSHRRMRCLAYVIVTAVYYIMVIACNIHYTCRYTHITQ